MRNAVKIQLKFSQNAVKTQSKCSQKSVKYSQNAVKIQSLHGVPIDWKVSVLLVHSSKWRTNVFSSLVELHDNQKEPKLTPQFSEWVINKTWRSQQKVMSKKKKSSVLATPDLVPWLPPGKPKEQTFNVNAHKKNSGIYDLSASMQQQQKIWSTSNSKKFSTDSSPWSINWNKEKQ